VQTDVWDEVWALAEDQHGAFTAEQAAVAGGDGGWLARQKRDRRIDSLFRGAYGVHGLLDDWTLLAAAQLVQPRAVAGATAAAKLHVFDGLEWWRPDLLVPPGMRIGGLAVQRVTDLVVPEITVIDGIRCTDAVRTLIDYAAVTDDERVERAMESVFRRDADARGRLVERARALRRPGKSGPARALRVEARLPDTPTDSDLETVYWQVLREHGVELPIRQHPVGQYLLDNAYVDAKVFVELDGYATHGDRQSFGSDRRRQNVLVSLGWMPLRFTDSDVRRYGRRTAQLTEHVLRQRRRDLVAVGRG
jgi:very-short-patch-repair endonuclease